MNQHTNYSYVLIACLMMILMLKLPVMFDAKSFRVSVALKTYGLGLIVLGILIMLYLALLS